MIVKRSGKKKKEKRERKKVWKEDKSTVTFYIKFSSMPKRNQQPYMSKPMRKIT